MCTTWSRFKGWSCSQQRLQHILDPPRCDVRSYTIEAQLCRKMELNKTLTQKTVGGLKQRLVFFSIFFGGFDYLDIDCLFWETITIELADNIEMSRTSSWVERFKTRFWTTLDSFWSCFEIFRQIPGLPVFPKPQLGFLHWQLNGLSWTLDGISQAIFFWSSAEIRRNLHIHNHTYGYHSPNNTLNQKSTPFFLAPFLLRIHVSHHLFFLIPCGHCSWDVIEFWSRHLFPTKNKNRGGTRIIEQGNPSFP